MKYLLFILMISTLSFSCGSSHVLSPELAEGRTMTLSHGGGFTGQYTTYTILENGQLFKMDSKSGNYTSAKTLDKNVATQIFANYDVLGLSEMKIETYGNLLYAITMKTGDEYHKVSWENSDKGSETLQLFYRNVMNQIKMNADPNFRPKKKEIKAKF